MKVMKFGGTSVGDGKRILHVARIIKNHAQKESIVVVVSAMCGVTDRLISIFQRYKLQKLVEARNELSDLYLFHIDTIKVLNLKKDKEELIERRIIDLFGQLVTHLTFYKEFSPADYDYVISFGERFSVAILNAALGKLAVKSLVVDSKDLIVTTSEFGNSSVLLSETKEKVENSLYQLVTEGIVPVVTGFYGATKDRKIATLGRGGSDYSATILAYCLDAQEVILWKEVDGVYSSDPKKNEKGVKFFPQLSYREAIKLAHNGAKIIHPHALDSMASKNIVVWVKNTFKPDFVGTKIWKGNSQ